jgi:lactate dehydrogenase-like 2-hydroxyacid dehydrogenase
LGIIGDGALGRSVADLGRGFGMRVLFAEYKGSSGMGPLYTPFDEVMRTSDIITLHCPWMPAVDAEHDFPAGVRDDGAPAPADQYGARRIG